MALDVATGKRVLIEWEVDPSKGIAGVNKFAASIRKEQKEERNLELVRKTLATQTDKLWAEQDKLMAQTDRLSKATTAASKASQTLATALGFSLAGAASKAVGVFGDLVSEAEQFTQASNHFSGNLQELREASLGLVPALELMHSRNRLNTLGVKMADEEYVKFIADITKMANVMGMTVTEAIDKATVALARGSVLRADDIGIILKASEAQKDYAEAIGKSVNALNESEKKLALQQQFLTQLGKKAAEAADPVNTLGTEIKKLSTIIWDQGVSAAAEFNRQWGENIKLLKDAWRWYVRVTDAAAENMRMAMGGKVVLGDLMGKGGGGKPLARWKPAKKDIVEKEVWGMSFELSKRGRGGGGGDWTAGLDWSPEMRLGGGTIAGSFGQLGGAPGWQSGLQSDERIQSVLAQANAMGQAGMAAQKYEDRLRMLERAQNSLVDATEAANVGFSDLAGSALKDMAAGMWGVAEAVVAGTMSIEMAVLALPKAVAMAVAQQATARAVEYAILGSAETAAGIAAQAITWGVPNPASTMHFAAAAKYYGLAGTAGAVAAGAGAIGLGLTAGMAAMGGGGGGGAGGYGPGSGRDGLIPGSTPTFGHRSERNQPINVNVYIGDPQKPATAMLISKQIAARINKSEARA